MAANMKRMSIDCYHAPSPEDPVMPSRPRHFNAADLTHLTVRVAELRHAPERKSWLYVLHISCASRQWQVCKRYSEIREFWEGLCGLLSENQESCTERCHFLAGCEGDKFPKKRLVHTRAVLEERANALEELFKKLTMRLNLCNARELARCHLNDCSMLRLISSFFEIQAQFKGAGVNPYNTMRAYHSMPLLKNRTKDGRHTYNGRLSLASLQEVHMPLE